MSEKFDITQLFKDHNEQIFRYIYARTGNKELSQDITSDTFLKAWNKRLTYKKDKASIKTWLYTIARNTMVDYFRSAKNNNELPIIDEIKDNFPEKGKDKLEQGQLFDFILKKMQYLSNEESELLTLRYINQLELQEISNITGKSNTAVRVSIHRALDRLRKIVNKD